MERFIEIWEEEERVALAADRDRRVETLDQEIEGGTSRDREMTAELVTEIEEFEFVRGARDSNYFNKQFVEENAEETSQHAVPPEHPVDEELREIEIKYKTLKVIASKFINSPEWSAMIKNLLMYRVMRYPQIIQSLMFLTGSKREAICLPKTNKLCWKWIREIKYDQIPKAMLAYQMWGESKGR